ncbi:alpha/beta hydrolase-fold protein [Chryseosolibacter indicus]|uniref:Dienelactone hydrolase family protein n=1 Tax=Chryseosolibacter indicus TaxID=2782351 RepID=A0ABS5VN32_9BACT|nr:prolyl oligopeptidase family serine peptidase [Chryseosolibacter indicus]MBT1702857.1 dienelactone hydrolase family protein [Chryseosolibacter indicus]
MKPVLYVFIFMTLLIAGCDKDEEVLATIEQQTAAIEKKNTEGSTITINSESYASGKFQEMPYRILLPRNYDASKKYPLLLLLHGVGERGTDNKQQLSLGSKLFQADTIREKYPAFIVFPQCPVSNYWFDKSITQTLKGLLDSLVAKHSIDKNQINIAGFSMGAYGTFAMVAQYPGTFKSAVAVSGDGDANKAASMAKTKWRIFAGKKDDVVSSSKTEKMAKALKASGASVSFKLYPEASHQRSWANASAEPDFCSWIFSTSKK